MDSTAGFTFDSFAPFARMHCAVAACGWSIGFPIWDTIRIQTSRTLPSSSFAIRWAASNARMLYSFPTCVTGFFPAAASRLIGRYGVMRPVFRFPRPTLPSSPFSQERPVTVR